MELQGERLIPADVDRTWHALNDPDTLKACIPGCESVTRTGDNAFESVVAVKVGPVSARFKGKLQMTNIDAPRAYTINFDGQGGAAGFGKGTADVALAPEGTGTRLRYNAKAQVGGKMAQIGSRLIDAAAEKITEEFFSKFEQQFSPPPEAGAAAAPAEPVKKGVSGWWWLVAAIVAAAIAYYVVR
jgi:carbon monoxide dehydrogenase subunit G